MSLLRNSVIVGGATFLVGSAFMEIGKADSKSDIGKWPYVATFLSGALGFYLLKQNVIPVPKALELNADYTDSDLSHFGKPLEDDEKFTTMQVRIGSPSGSTTSWTTAFNLQCVGDDDNLTYFTGLLEDSVRDRVRKWNGDELGDFIPMQIVIGSPSGSTTSWYRAFTVQPVDVDEENLYYLSGEIQDLLVDKAKWWNGHEVIYDAEIEYDGAKSYARSLDSKFDGANDEGYFPVDEDDFSEMVVDEIGEHTTLDAESFDADSLKGRWEEGTTRIVHGVSVTKSRYGEYEKPQYRASYNGYSCRIFYEGVAFYLPCWMYHGYGGVGRGGCFKNPMEAILDFKRRAEGGFQQISHRKDFDADTSLLQSFAAEVFMADRKIRRRTRWTWTRGNEKGFEIENDDLSELPYNIDYTAYTGRGYYRNSQPMYSIDEAYYISDLPEGYHLHLYKPSVRSGEWRAFSKSPTSEDWNEYRNYKKSNLTGDLLNWYNQDIAQPEEKTLSPIEKLMISKGMKSGTVQIERVVIPKTNYTPEKVQYFALGGPTNMSPTKFCEIEGGVIALENLRYEDEPNLFAFGQGLKFMTEKAGTLRSVNRFNKNPEAWVKSYPAWFQNAVKNKLTDIDVQFKFYQEHDGGIRINNIRVLKFLNGVDRLSWRPINESERKMMDTPYGEMPQFEIYELDMSDPAPITPRPSTMRKIYGKSFKQNLNGEWKFDKDMFMMAVVDKYKFENGGSERVHKSMVDEPLYSIDIIPYMTPMAELMARRYKKKE